MIIEHGVRRTTFIRKVLFEITLKNFNFKLKWVLYLKAHKFDNFGCRVFKLGMKKVIGFWIKINIFIGTFDTFEKRIVSHPQNGLFHG